MRSRTTWLALAAWIALHAIPASAQTEDESPPEEASASEETPSTELAEPNAPPVPPLEEAVEEPTAPEATAEPEASEPEASEPEESAPPPPSGPELTFANSLFLWSNAVSLYSFAPGAQLTWDPTYMMGFNFIPRFYLTDTTFLWLNQGMSVELTDANDTTTNRELLLDDTFLDIRQLLSWEGFVFQFAGRLGFPLSKASQAARRIMQTGLAVTATRVFPEAASFTVSASFGYRRWWATTNVPQASPTNGYCASISATEFNECQQATGQTSLRDLLVTGLTLSVTPTSGLVISMQGIFVAGYGHELRTETVPVNGGDVTLEDESVTHWRGYTYLALSVSYDVLPWLNLQLGIQNSPVFSPIHNTDGSVRGPFNPETQIFLTTTVTLDALYGEIVGGTEEVDPNLRNRRRQGLARRGDAIAF